MRTERETGEPFYLPNKEEMARRLETLGEDTFTAQRFFPYLLRNAERRVVPMGLVNLLLLAIHDYVQGMPIGTNTLMYAKMPEYIDAIVEDKKSATLTKEWLESILEKARQTKQA